jgi:hypothetical protein
LNQLDDTQQIPKVLAVYLRLANYPLLAAKIREQMRHEIVNRGIITAEQFEDEVRTKAILSQKREGLSDPLAQESPADWDRRLEIVRDYLTDFYFALNLPFDRFEEILRTELSARKPGEEIVLTFNPELAPWAMLFAQAHEYEALPPERKARVRHHLQQIAVVLIRGMISDQLDFIGVARDYFDIFDLEEIYARRIGRGKIGGKAAGMMLAFKILSQADPDDPLPSDTQIVIPNSYFLGADVFYDFVAHNRLFPFFDQKYKSREEIENDYPEICRRFTQGEFPAAIVQSLRQLLAQLGKKPLIVRSSSLLEDNFGKAFAGKYESYFCPNQGDTEENLGALLDAIRRVYASTLNPDALFYRHRMRLVDYDERIAILIQEVEGAPYGRYYFPAVAGVGFGRNPFRWCTRIRREDGFLRIVWGLGTRAVERVANDYPRMVALSHPQLRPEVTAATIARYSQHFVDVIDLEDNAFKTLPVREMEVAAYPGIEYLASLHEEDTIRPLIGRDPTLPPAHLVLNMDRLLQDKTFITLMRAVLKKLERAYGRPVDIEFTLEIVPGSPRARYVLHLLQCRPLSVRAEGPAHDIPSYVTPEETLFTATRLVPEGVVRRIEYVVYVDPRQYARAPDYAAKHEIARIVGRLNKRLEGRRFVLIGPGRWGSSNVDLGVPVNYADIFNAAMLIEVAFGGAEGTPEASYGTHFFQDLVEANIYPLALYPSEDGATLNEAFFSTASNALPRLLPAAAAYADFVKVVDVRAASGGRVLDVVMNAEQERAVGYLRDDVEQL